MVEVVEPVVQLVKVAHVDYDAGVHLQSQAVLGEYVDGHGGSIEAAAGDEQQRCMPGG